MIPAPDLAGLQATLTQLAADAGFSGAVMVNHGDELLLAAAYGYANRAWRAPCTLDTRFDTASVTKLFTAVAALQLVERGAFGLDTYSHVIPGLDEQAAATVARLILEGSDATSVGSPGSGAANSAAKRATPPTPERR